MSKKYGKQTLRDTLNKMYVYEIWSYSVILSADQQRRADEESYIFIRHSERSEESPNRRYATVIVVIRLRDRGPFDCPSGKQTQGDVITQND